MAGLVSRSWKESYKSVIIISGASSGAGTTHQQLTDGAGTTIPLYVASGSLRIESGKKMYFSDTDLNNYIYNSGTGVLNLVAETSINISPKLVVPGTMSAESVIGSTADIKGLVASTASFKGLVKAPTVSATTIKGTTLNMTTVSATTIKGGIEIPKGGTFTVALGTVKFASSPEYSIGLAADNKTVTIKANNVAAFNVQGTKVIPGLAGIDLGANAAASRWQNIYGASGFFKNLTVSTITAKGGTASLTTAKGTTASFKVFKSTSEVMLYDASLYLDKGKITKIIGGSTDVKIWAKTNAVVFASDNSLYPNTERAGRLGTTSNQWLTGNISAINTNSLSSASRLTMKAKYYYIMVSNLPTASTGLAKGGIYQSAGVLKVRTTEFSGT